MGHQRIVTRGRLVSSVNVASAINLYSEYDEQVFRKANFFNVIICYKVKLSKENEQIVNQATQALNPSKNKGHHGAN